MEMIGEIIQYAAAYAWKTPNATKFESNSD